MNEVRACESQSIVLGGIAIGIVTTALLWNMYGAIGVVTFAIPVLIWRQQSEAANRFNKYRI